MELRLQPTPVVEIPPASKGVVSFTRFFVNKVQENINEYPHPCLLVRPWRPKPRLLFPSVPEEEKLRYDALVNRKVQNPFIDDDSEEVYLTNPPPCFVLLGKRAPRVLALAEEISTFYGCVLIDTARIVEDTVKEGGEVSKLLERILRTGVGLTLNFILTLVCYKAHRARTRHRGYVITGLPSLPHGYDVSVEQQVNYLFLWDIRPTVFVHVNYDDEELVDMRSRLRYEFLGTSQTRTVGAPTIKHIPTEEVEEDDELMPIREPYYKPEADVNVLPSNQRVWLVKNEEGCTWRELELYDFYTKQVVDLFRARIDPQYFVTVDTRVGNEIEMVRGQLNLLPILRVPEPVPFIPLKELNTNLTEVVEEEEEPLEEEAEDGGLDEIIEMTPQDAFLFLLNKRTISLKFLWELSHYNYMCPVAMRDPQLLEGVSEFSVVFMRYIYFLSSKEAMLRFLDNPRPYVLPIRPKPPSRFIVLGCPLTGKTSLAKELATEYWVPYIDVGTVLHKDRKLKKKVYREFCRKKAEERELVRLTAEAWQEWRAEEEERIDMIEDWTAYIQCLLTQRIDGFYSPSESSQSVPGEGKVQLEYLEPQHGLELEGVHRSFDTMDSSVLYTPGDDSSTVSEKISKAMRHGSYAFESESKEVEAEAFLSALWSSFAHPLNPPCGKKAVSKPVCATFEAYSDRGEAADSVSSEIEQTETTASSGESIVWAGLLPPQSRSYISIVRKVKVTRDKKQAFSIMLKAAAKYSFHPSPLRFEFFRWRLPCWLDIPLCEKYCDNPLLLLRYLPECLMTRPPVPDPVDSQHPSVLDAGHLAYKQAGSVQIKQASEEVGQLICHAIKKAEKFGARVTGEVVTPGGWVLDNMVLDVQVWDVLRTEDCLPNYVFTMHDREENFGRILKRWCKANPLPAPDEESPGEVYDSISELPSLQSDTSFTSNDVINMLVEAVELLLEGDEELDDIYESIKLGLENRFYLSDQGPRRDSLRNNTMDFKEEYHFWDVEAKHEVNTTLDSSHCLVVHKAVLQTVDAVGPQLTRYGSALQLLTAVAATVPPDTLQRQSCDEILEFFVSLLEARSSVDNVMEWLTLVDHGHIIREVETTGKHLPDIMNDVHMDLMSPFIKKPRELLDFELASVEKALEQDAKRNQKAVEEEAEEEELGEEDGEEEDIRILGESGLFCVCCLDKNILLKGKHEFVLRYYGRLYFFSRVECKQHFLLLPEKFAPYYSAIRCLPPVRVWVVGPTGCGKTSLCELLADQMGFNYTHPFKMIKTCSLPHLHSDESITDMFLMPYQTTQLPDSHNSIAKSYLEKFLKLPSFVREYWTENPPYFGDSEYEQELVLETLQVLNMPPLPASYPALNFVSLESEVQLPYPLPVEPYFSCSMAEAAVKDYIISGTQLPKQIFDKTIRRIWEQNPFLTDGAIMDGYPYRASDLVELFNNHWLPDIVLELTQSEETALSRVLKDKLHLWSVQLEQEMREARLVEGLMLAIYDVYMAQRRKDVVDQRHREVITETLEKLRRETESEDNTLSSVDMLDIISSGSLEENLSRIPPDVETRIQQVANEVVTQEFPPMELKNNWETEEDARQRLMGIITVNYQRETAQVEAIKSQMEEIDVPWKKVDAAKVFERNFTDMVIELDRLKRRLDQRGEFTFTTDMSTAEVLLRQGYYFLSKFVRWCPVQVYNMKNPVNMFQPFSAAHKITPIVYRNYIYFVSGENEKQKFIQDPIKYTFNEPHHPLVPLRIAVIGPPKCGKSFLADRLSQTFGLKVITMGGALRFVTEHMRGSRLARDIDNYLRCGCFLPLRLKTDALVAATNDPRCVSQGFVFDGVPYDVATTQSLAVRGLLPFVILSLVGNETFSKQNRRSLDVTKTRLGVKNRVNLDMRYCTWNDSYAHFSDWVADTYGNLYVSEAELNTSEVFYWAFDILRATMFDILYYTEYCHTSRVLPLERLCISVDEFELRRSELRHHCPVCWTLLGYLKASTEMPQRPGLFQYRGIFYWVCEKHVQLFIKEARLFFPPYAPPSPSSLPAVADKTLYQASKEILPIHGHGRCVVTRKDFPGALDWVGSWEWAATYDGRVYLLKHELALKRFLALPWRYGSADTVFEGSLTIKKSHVIERMEVGCLRDLPAVGYLEQSLAELLQKALRTLGRVRPFVPSMKPETCAAVFVALFLKVNDPCKMSTHVEKTLLHLMLKSCRASRFDTERLGISRRPEYGQGDWGYEEPDETDSSDSLSSYGSSLFQVKGSWWEIAMAEPGLLDVERVPEKNLWGAKFIDPALTKMLLTTEDQLLEIPQVPKYKVRLKYQTYSLRARPTPPIEFCLTFLYSVREPLQLPEPFSYHRLFQYLPLFSSPFPQDIVFNPDKEFAIKLFKEDAPADRSDFVMYESGQDETSLSDEVLGVDLELKYMLDNFVPRFQVLDVMPCVDPPAIPYVIEDEAILFSPHRDLTYLMLYSQFFDLHYHVRCLQYSQTLYELELLNIIDKTLPLCPTYSDTLLPPRFTESALSRRDVSSYQNIFDAASTFYIEEKYKEPTTKMLILEVVEEILERVVEPEVGVLELLMRSVSDGLVELNTPSYEGFILNPSSLDVDCVEGEVWFREVLPFPPLAFTIAAYPYYSLRAVPAVFRTPLLDNMVHERHVSELDGILSMPDCQKYLNFPTMVQLFSEVEERHYQLEEVAGTGYCRSLSSFIEPFFPVFEFFNFHWTSFIVYPFDWAYNLDLKDNFYLSVTQLSELSLLEDLQNL